MSIWVPETLNDTVKIFIHAFIHLFKKCLFGIYVQGIWEVYKNESDVGPAHGTLVVMLWKIRQVHKWLRFRKENITKEFKFSINEDKKDDFH